MSDIAYIGEHLWPGRVGHMLVLLAFVSALYSAYAFYQQHYKSDVSWQPLARGGYWVHSISIFGVIGLILYAMTQHMYEYDYVYRTVSDDSAMRYLLAAFWADQEGSFLLWMFWHCILGLIFMYKSKEWAPVTMITLALIEAFLISMLLGLYLPFVSEDIKIGSNPFVMVRDVFDAPIFANADYLSLIEGRGLNPLLQNYWMTIHPPVLFLGFASLSIPFSMAIGGLSMNRHKELMLPLLKWALFAAAIYGLGILMGAAWAYEALTFGGYWAWDPVENTSLVPWLILVGGIHTNLIARATTYSIKTTYAYYLLAFVMIVYSTFLTRSGVLGDTSVHAFTTMGLESQLFIFLAFFILLSFWKYYKGGKDIPRRPEEERIYSREFWMFIGALILLFSGILMTFATSLPVYNKIVEVFDPNHIPIAIDDPMEHHNRYQLWVGVFVGIVSGLTIFLRYGGRLWKEHARKYFKQISIAIGIAVILTIVLGQTIEMLAWQHYALLFGGLLVIVSNLGYLLFVIKGQMKMSGAALSHVGFGVLILGIMYSGLNKKTITSSPFVQRDFVEGQAIDRAVVLIKNMPFYTEGYWMNYTRDTLIDNLRHYRLEFKKLDEEQEVVDEFVTQPTALYNKDFTKIAALNPGTERKLWYDVFTAAAPNEHLQDIEIAKAVEDSLKYLSYLIMPGDKIEDSTWILDIGTMVFDDTMLEDDHNTPSDSSAYDLTVGLPMIFTHRRSGRKYEITPGLGLKDAYIFQFPKVIDELGIKVKLGNEVFGAVYTEDNNLQYTEIKLQKGATIKWNDYRINLTTFNPGGQHQNYKAESGDIVVGAILEITHPSGLQSRVEPLFVLRGSQQFSIKDHDPLTGVHVRFTHIDPKTETMTFRIAADDRSDQEVEILIASDVPRSDILIVEANIFPGINLVWLGCLMMLFGLSLSLWAKRSLKQGS